MSQASILKMIQAATKPQKTAAAPKLSAADKRKLYYLGLLDEESLQQYLGQYNQDNGMEDNLNLRKARLKGGETSLVIDDFLKKIDEGVGYEEARARIQEELDAGRYNLEDEEVEELDKVLLDVVAKQQQFDIQAPQRRTDAYKSLGLPELGLLEQYMGRTTFDNLPQRNAGTSPEMQKLEQLKQQYTNSQQSYEKQQPKNNSKMGLGMGLLGAGTTLGSLLAAPFVGGASLPLAATGALSLLSGFTGANVGRNISDDKYLASDKYKNWLTQNNANKQKVLDVGGQMEDETTRQGKLDDVYNKTMMDLLKKNKVPNVSQYEIQRQLLMNRIRNQ